jgi:hypothetical protein
MANQSWVSLLNPASPQASGAGTALNSAATATISPVTGGASASDVAQVQPGGQPYGWYPGLLVRVTARGFITTTATSTTLTFLLASRVGNSGSTYVTLATASGVATSTTVMTGAPWKLEALVRCTAVATSGNTVSTEGELYVSQQPTTSQTLNTASAGVNLYLPNASGETAAAVDTTQLQGLSMRATLAGANATVQLTQWLVEALD